MIARPRALIVALASIVAPTVARAAYVEGRITGVDVHAEVTRDGNAVITHTIGYRVLAGTLRSFAVAGWGGAWRLRPTAQIAAEGARVTGATVTLDDDHTLHVTVDDPKGVKHGDYRFELVYEGPLRAVRDGAFDRLWLTLPPVHEGIDSERVVVVLPAAATEPRAASDGDTADDVVTVRRGAERDEIELVRPHVPKGEPATFSIRVDPKALPQLDAALPAPSAPVAPMNEEATLSTPSLSAALIAAASALALLGLASLKKQLVGPDAVGMVPGSAMMRLALASLLLGAGVLAQARASTMLGAVLVCCAVPLLGWRFRAPRPVSTSGVWRVATPEQAFASRSQSADFLDATTRPGLIVIGATVAALGLLSWALRAVVPPALVAIDALTLVPIFLTGTARQRSGRNASVLAPLARALSQDDLGVTPVTRGEELRLLVMPRIAMAGALGIEVAVAWEKTGTAMVPWLDVLVRVKDDTFAAAKMTSAFPRRRILPGRKPEERVYRFAPDWPTRGSTASRIIELADVLRDRRFHSAPPRATERRTAPNKRKAAA